MSFKETYNYVKFDHSNVVILCDTTEIINYSFMSYLYFCQQAGTWFKVHFLIVEHVFALCLLLAKFNS